MNKKRLVLEKLKFNPNEYHWSDLVDMAYKGQHHRILAVYPNENVKYAVAEVALNDEIIEILLKDKNPLIRYMSCKKLKHAKQLLDDPAEWVREAAYNMILEDQYDR